MHDRVAAVDQCIYISLVGQVATHELFVWTTCCAQIGDVGDPQHLGHGRQPLAQHMTQAACGTGQ